MTTKEQIKELIRMHNTNPIQFEKHWLEYFEQILDKQKEQIKKSLPTHPNKMLKRKEVIDIIDRI